MADRGDLLEVGRDQQHGQAARERGGEQAIDLGLGADVDAGGRVLEDQQLAARSRIQRAMTTFCWLPPESVSIGASGAFGRQRRRSARAPGPHGALRRRPSASRRGRGRRRRVEEHVLAHDMPWRPTSPMRSPATKPSPASMAVRRRLAPRAWRRRGSTLPPSIGSTPEQRPADRLLPGAAQPDQADHLAAADVEGDRPDVAADAGPSRSAPGRGRGAVGPHEHLLGRPADDRRRSARAASPRAVRHGIDQPAVAQHDQPVRDREDLVQPVRDVDHADALRLAARAARRRGSRPRPAAGSPSARRARALGPRRRAPGRSRPATSRCASGR